VRGGSRLDPLLVLLAAALVYANTLGLGFTWDDEFLILTNPRIADPGWIRDLLLGPELWRPLKRLSLMADHALWGNRAAGYHLTNLALNAAVCLLLHRLAARLGLDRSGALFAALVFALHPVHVEAVANISHRKESMAALFYLLSFLVYLRATGSRVARGPWLLGLPVLYLLGLLSKEVAIVMLPVMVVAWELLTPGERRRRWLRLAPFLGVLAAVLLVVALRHDVGSFSGRFSPARIEWVTDREAHSYPAVLFTAVQAFGAYAGLLVWPVPLYLDRAFPVAHALADPGALAGMGVLLAVAAGVAAAWTRDRVVAFGLLWWVVNLLPVVNLVPLTYWLIAERFLYVPSIGFALVAGALFARALRRSAGHRPLAPLLAVAGGTVVLVVLTVLTVRQNRVWRDNQTLWSHTLRWHPDSVRALTGLGIERYRGGNRAEAERLYREALRRKPYFWDADKALIQLLIDTGRAEEALDRATASAESPGRRAEAQVMAGTALYKLRRFDPAIAAFRRALELDPDLPAARRNLANALFLSGRKEEALALVDAALAEHEDVTTLVLRGTMLELLHRYPEAEQCYLRAAELSPTSTEPLNSRGAMLVKLNRKAEAAEAFARSLALDPDQPAIRERASAVAGSP
jgi:tetratricopeptide (TPR) repeat protein